MTPSIRRVFIEPNPSETYEELKHRLEVSEARNAALERDNRDLMNSCERYMTESAAHARGERGAIIELQRVKRQLEAERKIAKEEKAHAHELVEEARREMKLARYGLCRLLLFFVNEVEIGHCRRFLPLPQPLVSSACDSGAVALTKSRMTLLFMNVSLVRSRLVASSVSGENVTATWMRIPPTTLRRPRLALQFHFLLSELT